MAKLHEVLAAEPTRTKQVQVLIEDASKKFNKSAEYFSGFDKTLKLHEDSDANAAIEKSESTSKPVITTVAETLQYLFDYFATAEDLRLQKALTNQVAKADILFKGEVLVPAVPVDELLGLEKRLAELRKLIASAPTLDSSKQWERDANSTYGFRTVTDEVTTKTEKVFTPIILAPATERHPAQVKESETTVVIGSFTRKSYSGACTPMQKANALRDIDELIVEVTNARMRANCTEVVQGSIGEVLANVILKNFTA